jgi:TusE/DsrC/DsvC family sulfur relay protein
MPTLDHHGVSVPVDDDGFLLNGIQWTPDLAECLARTTGIARLTDRHWQIIALFREDAARRGNPPGVGRLSRLSGLEQVEIVDLFPGDSALMIARIAGLPRPR